MLWEKDGYMTNDPLIKELMSIEGAHVSDTDGFKMNLCEEEAKVLAQWMRSHFSKDGICLLCPPIDVDNILNAWKDVGSMHHPILRINGDTYHFMCKEHLAYKVIKNLHA